MDLLQELADVDRLINAASADLNVNFPVDPTLTQLPQPQPLLETDQVCFEQEEQRRQRKRDYMRAYRSKAKPLQKSPNPTFANNRTPEHLEEKRRKKREYMRTYREQAGIRKAAEDMVDMDSTLTTTSTEQPVLPDRRTDRPASMTQDAIRQRRHRQSLSEEKKDAIRAKNRERQRQRRERLEGVERAAMRLRDAERMRSSRSQKTQEEKEWDRLKNRERQKELRRKQASEREERKAKPAEQQTDALSRTDDGIASYTTESNTAELLHVIDTCLV